ncbi:hypothetical protein PV04_06058 [Phialophora macrospora]|uniref:Uncharacterized protein n=1 Tax=Phialophora macrospora TaxID=1851006 RepID=A0A0D2FFD4_9EURO|nr:hypothetical protein PV04_06058 [Phialophora macrospora]
MKMPCLEQRTVVNEPTTTEAAPKCPFNVPQVHFVTGFANTGTLQTSETNGSQKQTVIRMGSSGLTILFVIGVLVGLGVCIWVIRRCTDSEDTRPRRQQQNWPGDGQAELGSIVRQARRQFEAREAGILPVKSAQHDSRLPKHNFYWLGSHQGLANKHQNLGVLGAEDWLWDEIGFVVSAGVART